MAISAAAGGTKGQPRLTSQSAVLGALYRSSRCLHRGKRASQVFAAIAGVASAVGIARAAGAIDGISLLLLIGCAMAAIVAATAMRVMAANEAWFGVLDCAFECCPEAQLIVTPDGEVVQANPAFARLFAAAAISLDGIEHAAASPEAASLVRSLRERARSGEPASASIPLQPAGRGSSRLFQISVQPGVGRPSLHLWTISPIDAISRPAATNRDNVELDPYQHFFADAPVGIAVIDGLGRLIKANRALGELFDAAPDILLGRELIGFLNPEDQEAIAAKLSAAAAGRDDRTPIEIRLAPPSDRTMVLLLSRQAADGDRPGGREPAFSSPDEAAAEADLAMAVTRNPAASLTLYFIDVTEQKHLEAQIAQSQKMQAIGQLAGGVAHDFNNLLTAMIGFCDLLLLRSRPGDPAFADIMQIKQNANRAANLVRQLLAFSRQQSLQPRVLDITDVLSELSHLLRRLIGENIELKFAHRRDLGLVKVDQGQLEQVVINLAVNARDAMPNGGRLTIRTENSHQPRPVRRGSEIMPAGDYVLIEVADTGVGIAPDTMVRIFEPFFSTKEVGCGTGLGLSTVYGIVKQTGGFIFVESRPNHGTNFSIYLPRHVAGDAAPVKLEAEPAITRDLTGSGTIMLVEDDDAVRTFGARALRNKGYHVIEAKSGEAALETICSTADRIDLVITDVVMPQMDGPALIRLVREVDPAIKVIFISGYAEDAFRQSLGEERDLYFLPKPFNLKQFALKVKAVMRDNPTPAQFPDCQ
ncbi:MAG: response regulator [Alphaproteobacteria bacterium]|nr:response regulator [Alphaproteobacteria bacterium]